MHFLKAFSLPDSNPTLIDNGVSLPHLVHPPGEVHGHKAQSEEKPKVSILWICTDHAKLFVQPNLSADGQRNNPAWFSWVYGEAPTLGHGLEIPGKYL